MLVESLTKARMLAIEAASIVSGLINGSGHLILTKFDGGTVDAGNVFGFVPTGTVYMFAAAAAPSGWLLCDGTAVSRTTYAALYAVVGTTYGPGDNSTTFNLPNFKGRVPVGRDAAQTEFDSVGEMGGSKMHTLTLAELAAHTHVQNSHNHTQDAHNHTQNSHNHTQNSHNHTQDAHNHTGSTGSAGDHFHQPNVADATWGYLAYKQGAGVARRIVNTSSGTHYTFTSTTQADFDFSEATDETGAHTHSVTVNNATATNQAATATNQAATATNQAATATNQAATATNQNSGGDGAHNNLQPYLVMNYIIKT